MELMFRTRCGLGVNRDPRSGRQTCLYPRGKGALAVVLSCSLGSPYRMTYRVAVFIEALNPWTEPAGWRFKIFLVLLRVRGWLPATVSQKRCKVRTSQLRVSFTSFQVICICVYVCMPPVLRFPWRPEDTVFWDIELLDIGTGNWQTVRVCHLWAISP